MKAEDRTFFANFLIVLAALIVIAIVVGLVAGVMTSDAEERQGMDPRAAAVISERIAPVGQVAIGEPPAEEVQVASAPAEARSGKQIVETVCAGCHASGVMGAPTLGDTAQWTAVSAKGFDAVVSNAINGVGGMPAGGTLPNATDEELTEAVRYMFEQAGL